MIFIKTCEICNKVITSGNKKQRFCSNKCVGVYNKTRKRNRVKTNCSWCGKVLELVPSQIKTNNYCKHQHLGFANAVREGANIKQVADELEAIEWSDNISYLIGVIATDGTLRKGRKQIKISSSSKQYLESLLPLIQSITGRTHEATYVPAKFKGKIYDHYQIQFTSYPLYDFCLGIGIRPKKTYDLDQVQVPNEFFGHFLRGVVDGDGNYNKLRNIVYIRIYSGSLVFLEWINTRCVELYKISGGTFDHTENELGSKYILSFQASFDIITLIEQMYKNGDYFYLKNKKKVQYCLDNLDKLKSKYNKPTKKKYYTNFEQEL